MRSASGVNARASRIGASRWPRAASVSYTRSSAALSCAAFAGGWIALSPVEQTEPPSTPRPNPTPPTAAEAAAILNEAWKDPDWGTLVMFAMTTGARRGEICGLRWSQLDLDAGVAVFRASIGQIAGERWEKDTKTHQQRRVTLDAELVEFLRAHRARCKERAALVDTKVGRDGFVFSRRWTARQCCTRTR